VGKRGIQRTSMTRTASDTSIGIAVALALALIVGAYFLGAHQAVSAGPRFVPAQSSTAGFMFDNKTAQICWAGAPEGNPTLPKSSSDPLTVLNAPGIPTCKSLL
jgi:hypothetical protein